MEIRWSMTFVVKTSHFSSKPMYLNEMKKYSPTVFVLVWVPFEGRVLVLMKIRDKSWE